MVFRIVSIILLFAASLGAQGVGQDLAIGFDKKTDRPNAFIAWRNTQRILEIELEVKNLGQEQATGSVDVAVLDDEGRTLLSNPGPDDVQQTVTLPPVDKGGTEGKIVQVKGTLAMNLLIDELDRANAQYSIRARVTTKGKDDNLSNNVAVKTFNVKSRVKPSSTHFHDYTFRNTTSKPLEVIWQVESSELCSGWLLTTLQKPGQESRVMPNEAISGYMALATPKEMTEGQHADIRVIAVDKETKQPVFQSEWFVVYDLTPPELTGLGYSIDQETGEVEVTLTANDKISMLKEASGVRVEYSSDGGMTYSSKIMFYVSGNFVGPTRFKASLGPFASGAKLKINAIAEDIAGNIVKRQIDSIILSRK